MKNTKFIKVSTSDRLPEKPGTYDSNLGEVFYNKFREHFEHNDKANDLFPNYWFMEVPDYEEEMKEMLERIVKTFETDYVVDGEIVDNPYEWLQDAYKDAKQLIKEATELE